LRQRELAERAAIDVGDDVADDDLAAAGGGAVSSERFHQVTPGSGVGHEEGADANCFAAGGSLACFRVKYVSKRRKGFGSGRESVRLPGRDMDCTEREGEDGMEVTREAEVPA
jgi:hypothetical protein